jgi:ubiquinone/menaquinone biosynthesis C-methylase UbiE
MILTTMTPEMGALKTRLKKTWESGDYGVFAKYLQTGALEFFDRFDIPPGTTLLDLACGAGQLTLPAARRGIRVTGLDLAGNLVRQARKKAAAEGLDVRIDEGDAEQLPYEDGSFDVVMSLIGAMFAPRPELVASEMIRVCKPGGRIIMGNWTADGHIGQMFKMIGQFAPPPPNFPSPLLWGDEATCRTRLGAAIVDLQMKRSFYPFVYPFAPSRVVDFFIDYYGPTNRAYASLADTGETLRAALIALWARNNLATDGTTHVESEYLEVVATRA